MKDGFKVDFVESYKALNSTRDIENLKDNLSEINSFKLTKEINKKRH